MSSKPSDVQGHGARLVVIDPEDREQVERLVAILHDGDPWFRGGPNKPTHASLLQRALRAMLASPKPPKCTAALNIKGEHFGCDQDEGHGTAHGNTAAGAIWGESQ